MPYSPDQLETDVGYLTSLPQWQDEAQRPQFIRDVASKARTDADPDTHRQLVGELWNRAKGGVIAQGADFVQRSAGEVLKSIPAAPAAGLLAASDAVGTTDSGSGTRLMRGAADMADAVVQRVKQNPVSTLFPMAGVSGRVLDAALPDRQAARDNTLDSLRQDLDAGIHPAGLERWLSGDDEPDEETKPWVQALTRGIATRAVAADHMGKPSPEKINAWLKSDRNPAFLDSDTPGVPGPRALLADYLVTRDPSSWAAFKARVSETDSQYKTRLQRFASEAPEFTPTVNAAPKGSLSQEMITRTADMQTSPLDLASAVLPVLRSLKILRAAHAGAKGQTLLRRGLDDAAKEFGQEALTEMVSDPNASTAQILEAGAMGGIGQGVVSAPATIAGRLLRPATSIENPATSNQENDNLPPSQTTPASQPSAAAGAAAQVGGVPVPNIPGLEQHTGDLTPEEAADLQARAPAFQDDPFGTRQSAQGDVITDLRIPRSPQAIAQSQQQEQDRLAQQAKLRNTEAKTGRGPVLPESTGDLTAEDVQDLETQNLPLSSSSETLPTVANPDPAQTITGSNVQTGTEMPVPPPTADAGAGAGAPGVVNQSQSSYLDRVLDAAIQDESMGELTIPVPEKNQNRDDLDKAVAVIEARGLNAASDGKSILVRGFRELRRAAPPPSNPVSPSPSPQVPARNASRSDAGRSPSESSSPTGFTHTTLSRDLEAGFMTTAGADALLDLAHRAFAAGQTFVQWSKSMLQRFGESIRQWLAGAWDHAKRSSQTGAVNFTGRLGSDLQRAAQQAKGGASGTAQAGLYEAVQQGDLTRAAQIAAAMGFNVGPVFHGTTSGNRLETLRTEHHAIHSPELNTRLGAMFAVNRSASERFATGDIAKARGSKNGRVIASFLNIKNPLEFETTTAPGSTLEKAIKAAGFLSKAWSKTNRDRIQQRVWKTYGRDTSIEARPDLAANQAFELRLLTEEEMANAFKSQAIAAGYDGIYVKQDFSLGPVWIAFREDQIKLVDLKADAESKPAPNPAPSHKNQEPGLTNLTLKRDLESGFMTTAGADALLDLAHRAFAAGQTFVQWSKTMLQRFGDSIRQWLAGAWDHAKRSSQTGAVNFTGRLGSDLQRAAHLDVSGQASQRGAVQIDSRTVDETRSRFASPREEENLYDVEPVEVAQAAGRDWLAQTPVETALQYFEQAVVPPGMTQARMFYAHAALIKQLAATADTGTEIQRMQANALLDRAGRAWHGKESQEWGRAGKARAVASDELSSIATILAAKQLLVDRAKKVIDARFDGGAAGVTEKVKEVVKKADAQAGETLAGQLDDATSSGNDPRIADLEARLKELRTQMTAGDAAMQQTTSTWQKIMNLLNAASKRKSSMLNGARSKLSALREAALKRKAQRRSEGRLNANPVEDFADDAIIGAALLAEGIVEFANWSQAMLREIGARSSTELKELYAAASQQYHDALAEQQKRPSALISRDSPALTRLLDKLRRKLYPGMRWSAIFSELPDTQKGRQREIYKRLLEDEKLKDLTAEERLQLTNELDKAWMRERTKVFNRELEKAGILGEKKPKDREKVKAAAPRLLRLMNLGMLNSDMFREALAKEYGLKMIDASTAAELRALGERIQKAPEGLPRRKLEQQLMERLQSLAGTTLFQVIDSWWTASVLSGWRTQVDIGLSLANGIEDVGLGSIVTALRTGNKDVAIRGLASLFGRIPSAFMEAVDHVRTGNKALMRNFELEAKQALEGGNRLASDVGAQMWRDGGWRKVPGGFMIFYGRLMTALDHVNSASTREGAKAMALARHPELYQKALRISDADRQAARQQARLELTGGAMPVTQQERLEETARVREILDQGIPAEVLAEATEIGRAAALQGEPTGLGGALLDMVLSAVSVVSLKAESISKRPGLDAKSQQVLKLLQGAAPLARAITGTKFARTVAHSLNRTASYVPGFGAYAVGQQGRTGAFGDILAAKQVIGTLVGIALYLAFDDDDDERGIEDSWKDKTPQQKAQLYAQGKQPFTVWGRDDKGRVRSFNYQQWGIAGIVNTVAAMLKQKGSEQGTLNVLMSSLVQGGMSFTDKAQLQGLQTVFGEKSRSTDPASGIAANLNKWAAQTVGGIVPRLVKDIDMVASPELRSSSEWWQKWAKEVPMLRQLSSGKRVDILGADILLDRTPLSRVMQLGTADPVYRLLGRLNEKDIYLPDPSTGVRVVKLNDGTRRKMTDAEKDRYQRLTGAAYRDYLEEHGQRLLQLEPEKAKDEISRITARLRERAAYQATHR